jgi:hypothetical protein
MSSCDCPHCLAAKQGRDIQHSCYHCHLLTPQEAGIPVDLEPGDVAVVCSECGDVIISKEPVKCPE